MFQFPTFPSYTLLYSCMDKSAFTWFEFPHSDIHGSKDICSLPWLFAAYHVLLRLLVPRYPPYALCSLTLNAWKTSYCFANLQLNFPHRTHVLPRQICFDYQTTTRFWIVFPLAQDFSSQLIFRLTFRFNCCILSYASLPFINLSIYFSMCFK